MQKFRRKHTNMRSQENLLDGLLIAQVWLTAYLELVWLAQLQKGEDLLIHAGASGVGTAAIQTAKAIGANVLVTAGSSEKLDLCKVSDSPSYRLIALSPLSLTQNLSESSVKAQCLLPILKVLVDSWNTLLMFSLHITGTWGRHYDKLSRTMLQGGHPREDCEQKVCNRRARHGQHSALGCGCHLGPGWSTPLSKES